MMERILGLDFGEKRIGVAVSDPLGLTAQPRPYISNDSSVFDTLSKVISENHIKKVVLGLPKNREGGDSPKAAEVRIFAEKLSEKFGVAIYFQDERYSTKAVERHLIAADVRRDKRKQVIDSLAAQFILQGYLDRVK